VGEKAVPTGVELVTVWCVNFAALKVLCICVHLCSSVVEKHRFGLNIIRQLISAAGRAQNVVFGAVCLQRKLDCPSLNDLFVKRTSRPVIAKAP
jgi:hypothetical protein